MMTTPRLADEKAASYSYSYVPGQIQMLKPHRWQLESTTALVSILDASEYAYLQAPTGVGKTFAIVLLGEQLQIPGSRLIIVGTTKVANQHRQTLLELGFRQVLDTDSEFISPGGNLWIVNTWQGVAANPDNFRRAIGCAIQFFDECHLGGSHADNVSYRKIVTALQPVKKVQVSATTNVASEKLLGDREGHSYIYTLSQAYEDGLLNEVTIIEVETGTTIDIERVEATLGKSMDEIEELTDERLADLAEKAKNKNVLVPKLYQNPSTQQEQDATAAAKVIVKHRHDAMIDLYLCNHRGESCIFWCANVDAAERACSAFLHRVDREGYDISAATVHSKAGENQDVINQFERGKIEVIFAVQMLQEGFNMPPLWLAFDCRFHRQLNKYRIARMLQRIGRLTRKAEGKPTSRYYIAPDLTHYYGPGAIPRGSLVAAHILAAGDMLNRNDLGSEVPIFDAEEVELNATEVDDDEADAEEVESNATEVDDEAEGKAPSKGTRRPAKVKATQGPLYVIRAARGYTQQRSVSLAHLLNHRAALSKADFLARAKADEPRPPDEESIEGSRLRSYLRKDSVFAAAINAANPKWYTPNGRLDHLLQLETQPEGCTADRQAWRRLRKDPAIDALLREKKPDWYNTKTERFIHGYKVRAALLTEVSRTRIMAELLACDEKPSASTKANRTLYQKWKRLAKVPELDAELRAKKPHWYT